MNSPTHPVLHQAEDEISLIDIWLVLMRHKRLMVLVFLISVAAALAFALQKESKYSYSSSIEIGSIGEKGENGEIGRLIDNPATLLAKINNGYIPQVKQEFSNNQADVKLLDITARVPKQSSLVVLEVKTTADEGETAKQYENRIIELVRADHARMFDVVKSELNTELANEHRNLDEQVDAQKLIASKLEYNKVLSNLLERQIKRLRAQIVDIVTNRRAASNLNEGGARAMPLLMLDNGLAQNRRWVAELEERLQILIPADNDNLNKAVADTLRQQESIRAQIEQLQLRLGNLQETRAIIEPTRSPGPVGPSTVLIVLLGVVLGGMFAVFAAFFAEMITRVKGEMVQKNSN